MKTTQLIRLISIINSLFIIPACSAQNPAESLLEDILEDLSVNNDIDNSVNTLNWENELEELSGRLKEPVNLNIATREQLEQFPFLSDIQIEHLLAYIYIHGQMKTIYPVFRSASRYKEDYQYFGSYSFPPFLCGGTVPSVFLVESGRFLFRVRSCPAGRRNRLSGGRRYSPDDKKKESDIRSDRQFGEKRFLFLRCGRPLCIGAVAGGEDF